MSIPTSQVTRSPFPFVSNKQHPLFPGSFFFLALDPTHLRKTKQNRQPPLYLLRGVTAEREGDLTSAAALSVPSAFPAYRISQANPFHYPPPTADAPPHLQSGRRSNAGDEQRLSTSPPPFFSPPPPHQPARAGLLRRNKCPPGRLNPPPLSGPSAEPQQSRSAERD